MKLHRKEWFFIGVVTLIVGEALGHTIIGPRIALVVQLVGIATIGAISYYKKLDASGWPQGWIAIGVNAIMLVLEFSSSRNQHDKVFFITLPFAILVVFLMTAFSFMIGGWLCKKIASA